MKFHTHILPVMLTLLMLGTITIAQGLSQATQGYSLTAPSRIVASAD